MLYSLLTVAGSLSMAFGDDVKDNELVDRLSYSNLPKGYERTYSYVPKGYERTYSNIPPGYERTYGRSYSYVPPPGYERTYNFDPYQRTYGRDPYERTYSNDGHYPSQHGKYPPMKPHYPKYPSPHETPKPTVWKSEKTPKPSAWKKEKTPKPTWHKEEKTPKPTKAKKTPKPTVWKTPKPTKAEKTPKPTVWKTPRPTKAEKTPKPTWHKDEKTPKPTVWKSYHDDKAPKPLSEIEQEELEFESMLKEQPLPADLELEEGDDIADSRLFYFGGGGCSVRLGGACTNSPFGSASGECCSGCCENGRCVRRRRDWANFLYCPNECRGVAFGPLGTCDPLPPINN